MSLTEIAKVIGAKMLGPDVSFSKVSTDTRTLQRGELFISLQGENFDANNFISEAESKGAAAIVVNKSVETALPQLIVENTSVALGEIGAFNRSLSTACVIGVTGSQGKTTVKEMLAAILAGCGETVMTKGNLNNNLGVPMSLLNINQNHEFAVIEMGANGHGEISRSTAYTRPDIAHITNVAPTHLEGFGTIEGVAKAKSELWEGLGEGGLAVINIDDDFAETWCQENSMRPFIRISASGNPEADYSIASFTLNPQGQTECKLNTPQGVIAFRLSLLGQHNLSNALAAAAISLEAGASKEDVVAGLAKMLPIPGRLQPKKGQNNALIIDDSYNASPTSFKAAIDVLSSMPGYKILVAGDMGELGANEVQGHQEIGEYARMHGIDAFYATGVLSRLACESYGKDARHFNDQTDLFAALVPELSDEVCVLVKGSRSARLDKLVHQLTNDQTTTVEG